MNHSKKFNSVNIFQSHFTWEIPIFVSDNACHSLIMRMAIEMLFKF